MLDSAVCALLLRGADTMTICTQHPAFCYFSRHCRHRRPLSDKCRDVGHFIATVMVKIHNTWRVSYAAHSARHPLGYQCNSLKLISLGLFVATQAVFIGARPSTAGCLPLYRAEVARTRSFSVRSLSRLTLPNTLFAPMRALLCGGQTRKIKFQHTSIVSVAGANA